jgi:secondary thiamine-phosphate synthase enzyme
MAIYLDSFSVKTTAREVIIDITDKVEEIVEDAKDKKNIREGVIRIYVPHTTAAVTINENADPDVKKDIINILGELVPKKETYLHLEGNSDAHMKSSLIGCSIEALLNEGKLVFGTWQGIELCEFDGPRIRNVYVQVDGD